jgi:FkbM family methyltransferase
MYLDCCGPLSHAQTLPVALQELIGLVTFNSQQGQDRWILLKIFPNVKTGYFVDVGSADGTLYSNTKALEDRGWNGICIDPFPSSMEDRTCTLYKRVVYSKPGKTLSFRMAGEAGGIEDHIGKLKNTKQVQVAKTVEFETTTLNEILAEARAPEFIQYISLDIEGAELEALKGFDFSKYKVGAFTIEHNYEEPKRTQIRDLLAANGYSLERRRLNEDWYVPQESLAKYSPVPSYSK